MPHNNTRTGRDPSITVYSKMEIAKLTDGAERERDWPDVVRFRWLSMLPHTNYTSSDI